MSESVSPQSNQEFLADKNDQQTFTGKDSQQSLQEINSQHEIQKYINEKKELHSVLMSFLEQDDTDNIEQDFQKLIHIINYQKQEESKEKFDGFLQLITNIANNSHREKSLYKKLFQIIQHYSTQIKQTYSNTEIFDIFSSNKLILLFLFENDIITIDDDIYSRLLSKSLDNDNNYSHFFYPELKKFYGEKKVKNIENELLSKNSNIFDNFDQKRHEGENDFYICSLIREDSLGKFIEYVHQNNIQMNSKLKSSIFETNNFLIENKNSSLIEYASFYGSIQIFKYLINHEVEFSPSLWLYSIHSRNADLIQILESNNVNPPSYEQCFCESIKCHHNEFADYINENFLQTTNNEEIFSIIIQSHNYAYLPFDFEIGHQFFYLCSNKYNQLAAKENKVEIIYYLLLNQNTINDDVFKENNNLKKIAIPSSITSIGNNAFNRCSSLTQITIPSSITSIGNNAFEGCLKLTKITIPSSVTSIGDSAFSECSSLTQITIPSSVTIIGNYTFFKCISLKKIIIPSSVTSIGKSAFRTYSLLEQITIPPSVTSIGKSAFRTCDSLKQITIPPSVTSIGKHAFTGCVSLKTITILTSDKSFDSEQSELQLDNLLVKYEIQESSSKEEKERINKLIEVIKTFILDFSYRKDDKPIQDGFIGVKIFDLSCNLQLYRTLIIKLKPSLTVSQLKELIHNIEGYKIERIRLLYNGLQLEDENLVKNYEVHPGRTINLVPKMI